MKTILWLGLVIGEVMVGMVGSVRAGEPVGPYRQWNLGPPSDPTFFPIAVWLQSPAKAGLYREAGINTYVGLWKGPTEEQLASLKAADMKVICHQNATALRLRDDPTIIGWMHGDEPDNAQSLGEGKGYGPPIAPERIISDYQKIRQTDPSRPVLLNLGQGVAWDRWHGRGVRTNHPEDYPEYIRGCDIASFDIYPVAHDKPEVAGKLWYVARGVERLIQWSAGRKIVWNCIECTRISHPKNKATPQQVAAEVWMSLIHGSRGIIYFVHEWQPKFNESALLSDPEMLASVTALNRRILELAPVLNQPDEGPVLTITGTNPEAAVAARIKHREGTTYLFAVGMRDLATIANFNLPGLPGKHSVEVLGENRSLVAENGVFTDRFEPWAVHLYQLKPAAGK